MEVPCQTGANQSKGVTDIDTSRVGQLLIAHPKLAPESWFARTVVYIYADDVIDGTKGIVLNMPSVLTVHELCQQRGIEFRDSDTRVFQGGPIAGDAVIMLHSDDWQSRNTTSAGPGYRLSSDYDMFEKIANFDEPAYWRVFAGIASWAPGQLDMELEGDFPFKPENSWLIAEANDDIMFSYDGYYQWEKAIDLASQQMFDNFI